MGNFNTVLALLVLAALGGGGWLLATWDIPVPAERVEKAIPDDRMPR